MRPKTTLQLMMQEVDVKKIKEPKNRELLEEIFSLVKKIERRERWYWTIGRGILFTLASTVGFILLIIVFLRLAQALGFVPYFGDYLRNIIIPILEDILNQRLPG